MVLEPIPPRPPAPAGVEIRTGGAELCEPLWMALGGGQLIRRLFNTSWAADPRVRLAVVLDDGEPVAAATAMRSGSTTGIYSVGTVEGARRRGYGRAVTWAAIGASVDAWGSEIAILTSTAMAVSLYRSMGFEQIGRVHIYERRADRP
jgi:ribosomal protein S18 acetylase RimI-like enzyme